MIDKKLYDELMVASELELYDKSKYILWKIKRGINQEKEVHTCRKVIKDRGLSSRDLLNARDARRIADQLVE